MKKLLLILLVTLLAFTITACSGEDEPEYSLAPGEGVEGQEATDGDEADSVNGADHQEVDDTDREGTDREGTDREDTEGEEADRDDRRASSDGPHGLDPNDPNLAANIEFMSEEGSTWSEEAYEFADELEEELWRLIELLEEELDRLLEPLFEMEDQDDRIDSLSDQFDYFIEDIYEQWDNLHERYYDNAISTQSFFEGLERLVDSVRNFRFR